MEKILNQEEIDALFRAAQGKAQGAAAPTRQVLPFNFRAASQADEQNIRAVTLLQESFARNLSNSLSAYLRVLFQVSLVSAEQLPYGEFLPRIPELTYVSTINITGGGIDTCLIAQFDLAIVIPMIDLMLGGRGRPEPEVRDLTEIEEHILETVLELFLREASLLWEPYGVTFTFGARQPQSEVVRLMEMRDRILAFGFEIRLPEIRGAFNLVFPALVSTVLRQQRPQRLRDRSRSSARMREILLDCAFPVAMDVIRLAIEPKKVLDLEPGDVLTFRREIDQPVAIVAGGVPLFSAQLVRKNACRAALLQQRMDNEMNATGKSEGRA